MAFVGKEKGYQEAVSALVAYVSGFPQKVPEKVFNAFEYKKIKKGTKKTITLPEILPRVISDSEPVICRTLSSVRAADLILWWIMRL